MKLLFYLSYFSCLVKFSTSNELRSENNPRQLWRYKVEEGECEVGSNFVLSAPTEGKLDVITYNVVLWDCGRFSGGSSYCSEGSGAAQERAEEIGKWAATRDEDVIILQELFGYHETIKNAMIEAGFCHYIVEESNWTGSPIIATGMAIFSKLPIEEHDFERFRWQIGAGEAAIRGIQYVKIKQGTKYIHLINTHTTSTTFGDRSQKARDQQFQQIADFVNRKQIDENELILMGGDMNQDKYREPDGEEAYEKMLQDLNAKDFIESDDTHPFTYDTDENALVRLYHGTDPNYKELLDYIFYSKQGLRPNEESKCETIIPISTVVTDTNDPKSMLSDHFPVICKISYPSDGTAPSPGTPSPPASNPNMLFAEVEIFSASLCNADYGWSTASPDPYVKVIIQDKYFTMAPDKCGETTKKAQTNDPLFHEIISCKKYPFSSMGNPMITLEAYDEDYDEDDMIGSGSVAIETNPGDYDLTLDLKNGNCNYGSEDGKIWFRVHVEQSDSITVRDFGQDDESFFGQEDESFFGQEDESLFGQEDESLFGQEDESLFGQDDKSLFGQDDESLFGHVEQSDEKTDDDNSMYSH